MEKIVRERFVGEKHTRVWLIQDRHEAPIRHWSIIKVGIYKSTFQEKGQG